jgi:NAD(P)-dependent dehydrogenase (short-subunit alcohol dehydrogenase family)
MTDPTTYAATFHDLKDASVFITGGGSGIGAALTEGFLRQGAKVAFVQRSDATAFVDRMEKETGNRPLFLPCNVTDTRALKDAIEDAAQAHGPIRVLVNNAANDSRMPMLETTEQFWQEALDVNLKHYFFATQAVVPMMRKAGGGTIINYSSISYMMADPGMPVYMAANAAITALTRTFAREFGKDGIRVNAIAPGWVLTERQLRLWASEKAVKAHVDRQSLKERIQPADMVGATLFLASDASRVMTGQIMVLDGGVVLH